MKEGWCYIGCQEIEATGLADKRPSAIDRRPKDVRPWAISNG